LKYVAEINLIFVRESSEGFKEICALVKLKVFVTWQIILRKPPRVNVVTFFLFGVSSFNPNFPVRKSLSATSA
jgi:hypothetical protein